MQREYDFIIYGASGYTAAYVIDFFKKEDVRLALAARDISKIVDTDLPKYECQVDCIDNIAAKARVLINCAGPYYYHGEDVVKACIRNKTHYMDITGETCFVELLIKRYHEEAVRNGVYIINCCGFDSVPTDIGVMYLSSMLEKAEIESTLNISNLVLNKTTWESLIVSVSILRNSKALRKKEERSSDKNQKMHHEKPSVPYRVIFRGSDYFVIRRSQELLSQVGLQKARFSAYLQLHGMFGVIGYWIMVGILWILSGSRAGRWILMHGYRVLTFGVVKKNPSVDEVHKAKFTIKMNGTGEINGRACTKRLVISGPDPSYITTSICLTQVAIAFLNALDLQAENTGVMHFKGGVITPGCVLFNTDIVKRLTSRGIRFEID
ncbi:hypothetical protein OCOL_000069 [Ordospora colligata]|uniref:Saccharopine dehydrogenase NADP binding domain-containing protein n=1 Tax=Ordospora colligata OC4 TaxID=1354746 RepID=A0A0B2UL71_9MICR|nr:uncharacterized protein M896_051510 [Ordospora colligata OC4]KHN69742.1 hypothetical protein M896_051510 [Ordospora colligata OC4]